MSTIEGLKECKKHCWMGVGICPFCKREKNLKAKICPDCLRGFRRDVVTGIDEDGNEITQDVECTTCDGIGVVNL